MRSDWLRLAAAAVLAGALAVGGLVDSPAAGAAITSSQITTPANPSFFIADEDAAVHTFAVSGTTSGGSAGDKVDIRCYFGGTSVKVKTNVPLTANGSFSVPSADLNRILELTCQLRAVAAGTNPADVTPFAGPVVGVGDRDTSKVSGGANDGKAYDYSLDAQQLTAAFDYVSLGSCGLHNGFLYDSAYANTTVTFACDAGLGRENSPVDPTRSELQVDGSNAYAPAQAFAVNPDAGGLPALTEKHTVDKATGNVVIEETDPIVECSSPAYPPTTGSCATYVSAGITDERTVTQDHDGHISWITDTFKSTDSKAHVVDLLWDDNQQFFGASGDASKLEYQFPGESGFSRHKNGDTVSLPSSGGAIFVRMQGAADGATGTGQGAIVYDRPATSAKFTAVTAVDSEFTLHQTGKVPAGGSTRFRFAYVQDYRSALVAARAKAARNVFLNMLTVSRGGKGRGRVTGSPRGISCGKTCSHGYAYGTLVTLKAKAGKGSRFAGWSGACRGRHACKVTMTANAAVEAKFVRRRR